MKPFRQGLIGTVLLTAISMTCEGGHVGECKFGEANSQKLIATTLSGRPLLVLRPDADPAAIHILQRPSEAGDVVDAVRVSSGSQTEAVRIRLGDAWPPAGYTAFASGPPLSSKHPLIESGKIRFEYLGKRSRVPFLEGTEKGSWSVEHDETFTGIRRLVLGTHLLVSQQFEGLRSFPSVEGFVQIEPDGDRIVCVCEDPRGTWVGVFSKQRLTSSEDQR